MTWVPLHLHSQYSILDSTASIPALVQKAKSCNMRSAALTDSGNLFGAVEFYKACKSANIKAIIGCEMFVAPTSRLEKKKIVDTPAYFPIILLAENREGYSNLCKLSSCGFLDGFYYQPRIDKELLKTHSSGLICLSGPSSGEIAHLILKEDEKRLIEAITFYKELFKDNFFFELQRHGMEQAAIEKDEIEKEAWVAHQLQNFVKNQKKVETSLLELSKKFQINCVATNDTHYIERKDWKAHEILLNVQSGEPCEIWEKDSKGNLKTRLPNPKRKIYNSHEFYFKSIEEMSSLFKDIPEALSNSIKISEKCSFDFDFHTKHYPVFLPPSLNEKNVSKEEQQKAVSDYLYNLCLKGIEAHYRPETLEFLKCKHPNMDPKEMVKKRLDYEFEIVSSKGLCDYILIVNDFISWAKNKGIPVGPGRGSVVGSIIAYLLGIVTIEPLRFNLFFERFINPERLSYPDIDVDICMERRGEVFDYTINKYGKDKVAQIITFGTMKAKMAIRDVGRVLSIPLSKVNDIAKLIPEESNITLQRALEEDQDLKELYDTDEDAQRVIDIAKTIEGSIRNTSTHAAGIIISADPITDHLPVCTAKDSDMAVTQYSMKPVEMIGMLKIDFLGLKTLTSLQKTTDSIFQNSKIMIDWEALPLDDEKTFDLLNQGKTNGIFQLESGGMQELIKQLHIDRFEEIIAVNALYRPGPMDMIPSFINRKHKKEEVEIDHPLMKEILDETYGVMVYQEQVMQIASRLAGYSLGEGDVLRRAMGKKDKTEMKNQKEKFISGALKNGINVETSTKIFDKIEKFASYGFNKSHAAAYAYLSYATAYFKANFPKEWMAALLTSDRADITKVAKLISECQGMSISILPPDVNESGLEFTATPKGVRFAISGIKGVGEGVVEAIISERKNGPFTSFIDFLERIDLSKIGKKAIELLIESGAFDWTNKSRDHLKEGLSSLYEQVAKSKKEMAAGIMSLFSMINEEFPITDSNASSKIDILKREKELLGFYLTSHPLESYKETTKRLSCMPLKKLQSEDGDTWPTAFVIDEIKIKVSSKNQKKFAILKVSDELEHFEVSVWSDLLESKIDLIQEGSIVFAILQIDKKDEGNIRLQCRHLDDLTKMNDEKITECNKLLQTLKGQRKKLSKKFSSPVTDKISKITNTQFSTGEQSVIVKIDANKVRLSHILELKKIFRSSNGNMPITLHFTSGEVSVGKIVISGEWGINFDENVGKIIKSLYSVIDCNCLKT